MSDYPRSEGRPTYSPAPQGQARVTVAIPDALSNMVFIEAAPFWLCLILGIVGAVAGGLRLLGGAENYDLVTASAVCAMIGAVGLLVCWHALWRWALRGYSAAITALYVSYLLGVVGGPLVAFPMAGFVLLPTLVQFGVEPGGGVSPVVAIVGLVVVVVLGLIWVLALLNLFEWRLWNFARLDGRCPSCRRWHFGRIKPPATVTCAHCGTVLEFVRDDEQQGPRES